jgi:hypothetical protein
MVLVPASGMAGRSSEDGGHFQHFPLEVGSRWLYEAMAMMRKGQVRNIGGRDIRTQATFVAGLFQVAA